MPPPRALASLLAAVAVAAPAAAQPADDAPAAAQPADDAPATLDPSLVARMDHATRPVPVLVTLHAQVGAAAHAGRPGDLIRTLRRTARHSQPALLARLGEPARRFWLSNAIALRATPRQIRSLAVDPAVARIEHDRTVHLGPAAAPERLPGRFGRGDWGLAAIGAPAVWRDYGLDGSGVLVGSIDTGVDPDHPDLAGKIVAWADFANGRREPYDDNGHGTHTVGTMVGGATGGAPIGVAPGARAVVAKALDRNGNATLSTLMAAAEWIADPDGDPETADNPTVVNASWGAPAGAGPLLRPFIARWRQLGIVPVFAAGNTGRSVATPASYPEALAVGAVGPGGRIAPFSSREPRPGALAGTTFGPATGPARAKPDLAGPGVDIVSALRGGGWIGLDGTSMAAPHVAGTVALLRQADPRLRPAAVEAILRRTARDLGTTAADGRAGAGALDARGAVAAVVGERPSRPGLTLVARPPTLTNDRAVTVAVETGGARVAVWLDGGRLERVGSGPLVRVPLAAPGAHQVTIGVLDRAGAVLAAQRSSFGVRVDRTRPAVSLALRRGRLLWVGYRARATDAGAGVARGSLFVRLSESRNLRSAAAGGHTFTGPGPYWVEAQATDRAGNVARLRRRPSWPAGPVRRRVAANRARVTLRVPFLMARRHRRFAGHYRPSRSLAALLAANCAPTVFVPLATPDGRPAVGAVGVWTNGAGRMLLSTGRAGRRYVMEDRDGAVRSWVRSQ